MCSHSPPYQSIHVTLNFCNVQLEVTTQIGTKVLCIRQTFLFIHLSVAHPKLHKTSQAHHLDCFQTKHSRLDSYFKFSREEHWWHLLEWQSHIWMVIQIFIRVNTHSSKSWRSCPISIVFENIFGYFIHENMEKSQNIQFPIFIANRQHIGRLNFTNSSQTNYFSKQNKTNQIIRLPLSM